MSTQSTDCHEGLVPRRSTLESGGVTLSYLEWGSTGKPALLLHGITSSARGWWRVAPGLVAHGYHVFAVDMPGHGESGDTTDHTIDAVAALIGGLLQMPVLHGAVVIGHSWGGAVALTLATSAGSWPQPSRLVLIDPALQLEPEKGAQMLPSYGAGVGDPPATTLIELRAANPDWHHCDYHWKAEALERCRMEAVEGFFIRSGCWNLVSGLAEVPLPLLLIVADLQFTVIQPETLDAAEQAVCPESGQIVIIPGSTHSVFRSRFDPFMQVLLPWLEG